MKPIIVRQVPLKKALLFIFFISITPIFYILTKLENLFVYMLMLLINIIIGLMAWYFSKVLAISEETLTFKNGIFSKPRSIPLSKIETISPHYVGDSLLYLNIIQTNGDAVKITTVSDEVLKVLQKQQLL